MHISYSGLKYNIVMKIPYNAIYTRFIIKKQVYHLWNIIIVFIHMLHGYIYKLKKKKTEYCYHVENKI